MTLPKPNRIHSVIGVQNVRLTVSEFGTAGGHPIVLIHGWSQSHQSWVRQYASPLAEKFRVIVPDLRGHGSSDKPDTPEHYDSSAPWAEDLHAILQALALKKPVLIGWSMGGWVVQDYLRHYGDSALGGVSLVGSSVASGSYTSPVAQRTRTTDDAVHADGMLSPDLTTNLEATIAFVKACFFTELEADDLALMVGFNMMCPPHIRKPARGRSEDHRPDLGRVTRPALVQWGTHGRIGPDPMPKETAAALPGARLLRYENSGHAPFWDEPQRFNTDLEAFIRKVQP